MHYNNQNKIQAGGWKVVVVRSGRLRKMAWTPQLARNEPFEMCNGGSAINCNKQNKNASSGCKVAKGVKALP